MLRRIALYIIGDTLVAYTGTGQKTPDKIPP